MTVRKTTTDFHYLNHAFLCIQFADILRGYVGVGREWSYQALADHAGFEARTIKGWCLGEAMPPLDKLLRLTVILGPVFTNQFLGLAGYEGAGLCKQQDVSLNEVNAECADLIAASSKALVDGHMTHQEVPVVLSQAREAVTALQRLINKLKNASKRGASQP